MKDEKAKERPLRDRALTYAGLTLFLTFYCLVDFPSWVSHSGTAVAFIPTGFAVPALLAYACSRKLSHLSRAALGAGCAGAGVSGVAATCLIPDPGSFAWIIPIFLLAISTICGFALAIDRLRALPTRESTIVLLGASAAQSVLQIILFALGLTGSAALIAAFVALGAPALAYPPFEKPVIPRPLAQAGPFLRLSPTISCLFVCSFALEPSHVVMFSVAPEALGGSYIPAVGRLVACAGLAILGLANERLFRSKAVVMCLFAVVVLDFSLYPLLGVAAPQAFSVAGNATTSAAFLLCLTLSVELVRDGLFGSFACSSLVLASMYLGGLTGGVASRVIDGVAGLNSTGVFGIAMSVVSLVSLVSIALGLRADGVGDPLSGEPRPDAPSTDAEARRKAAEAYGLTAREAEVLAALMGGNSVLGVADKLCISENTVKGHMKNIYCKMGVHSRQEMVDAVEGLS